MSRFVYERPMPGRRLGKSTKAETGHGHHWISQVLSKQYQVLRKAYLRETPNPQFVVMQWLGLRALLRPERGITDTVWRQ